MNINMKTLEQHVCYQESEPIECIDFMIETQWVDAVMNYCICDYGGIRRLIALSRINQLEMEMW